MRFLEQFTAWVSEIADQHADGRARRAYEVKNGFDEPRNRRELRMVREDRNADVFAKAGMSTRRYGRWQDGATDRMGSEPVRQAWWSDR